MFLKRFYLLKIKIWNFYSKPRFCSLNTGMFHLGLEFHIQSNFSPLEVTPEQHQKKVMWKKKIQTNKNKKWFKYLPSIVQVVVLILSTNNTAVNHKHIISNTFKYEGVEDFFCLRMLIVFKTSWLIYTCSFHKSTRKCAGVAWIEIFILEISMEVY